MNRYQGSPSLSPDAREKVLQTFRHTLQLAQEGRNEEALLGCDFLLKMDARFAPARRLLESLRGVPVGTPVELSPFAEYMGIESAGEALEEAAEVAPPAFPEAVAEAPAMPSPGAAPAIPAPPEAPAKAPAGLNDLIFDDFASADPFADNAPSPFGAAAPPKAPEAPQAPPPPAAPAAPAPEAPAPAVSGLDDLTFPPDSVSSAAAAPAAPSAAPSAPAEPSLAMPPPGPAVPGAPAKAPSSAAPVDPRITQFLKQGDEALARGNPQEAIDLWSRVFLIDLANEDASKRIDAAREAQAATARQIDMLLSEGIQQYDAGDLQGARKKFAEVLTLSETDTTARNYIGQIDSALAPKGDTAVAPTAESDFMKHELEAPHMPSYAPEEDASLESAMGGKHGVAGMDRSGAAVAPEMAAPRRGLDIRVLIGIGVFVLAAVAGGTYWFLRRPVSRAPSTSEPRPAIRPGPGRKSEVPAEDVMARAQALFDKGKVDEAIQALLTIPDGDPRHNEAIAKIDQFRQAGAPVPTPVPAAARPPNLEELRAAGFAALKASRYIEAVKALDPVAKARPEDVETVQALAKANEKVKAFGSALKSYNEADYESAIKLLWPLRKEDEKNQDVEDYLVNAYVNNGIQSLQSGNMAKAANAFSEALQLRANDSEAQRLLAFARRYQKGSTDLLSRTFVKHLVLRP